MKRNLIVQAFPGQPQMQAAVEALFNDAEATLSSLTAAVEAISALSGDTDGIVAALAKKQARNDTLDAISLVPPDPGALEQIQAGIFSIRAIDAADTKSLVTRELGDSRWLGQNHQAASSGKWATPRNLTGSGDVSWSLTAVDGTANVNATTTLATVNANTGTFGGATTSAQISVNGKGLITGVSAVTITPAFSSITGTPTTLAGYGITLTSGNVTTALGYTPTSVTGLTGIQTVAAFKTGLSLVKADVGLGSVDNIADAAKAVLSATKWTTARNLAGNSVDGSGNVAFANKFIVQGTADTGLSAAQFLGALGTGILKNTTTTGVLSIAVAADFPTLNQSTTGSAATLTTSRNIDGQAFNGSADITVIAPGTHAATSKATPVDADEMPLADSAATFALKKLTWANLKATLKTYLDTLYLPINGALASFTPAWAGVTVGNGTVTAKYVQSGKLVFVRLVFTLGSTSAVTGDAKISLPVTASSATGNLLSLGRARFYDLSADAAFDGDVQDTTTTTVSFRINNVAGTYSQAGLASSTVPFTWAVGDVLTAQFWYEAA